MLARISSSIKLNAHQRAYVNFTTAYIEMTLTQSHLITFIANRIILNAKVPMHLLNPLTGDL